MDVLPMQSDVPEDISQNSNVAEDNDEGPCDVDENSNDQALLIRNESKIIWLIKLWRETKRFFVTGIYNLIFFLK